MNVDSNDDGIDALIGQDVAGSGDGTGDVGYDVGSGQPDRGVQDAPATSSLAAAARSGVARASGDAEKANRNSAATSAAARELQARGLAAPYDPPAPARRETANRQRSSPLSPLPEATAVVEEELASGGAILDAGGSGAGTRASAASVSAALGAANSSRSGRGLHQRAQSSNGGDAGGSVIADTGASLALGGATAPMRSLFFDAPDLRNLVCAPVPFDAGVVQCTIERDRSGLSHRVHPVYSLFLTGTNGADGGARRFLLAGRKRIGTTSSTYTMATDAADIARPSSHAYLGE